MQRSKIVLPLREARRLGDAALGLLIDMRVADVNPPDCVARLIAEDEPDHELAELPWEHRVSVFDLSRDRIAGQRVISIEREVALEGDAPIWRSLASARVAYAATDWTTLVIDDGVTRSRHHGATLWGCTAYATVIDGRIVEDPSSATSVARLHERLISVLRE